MNKNNLSHYPVYKGLKKPFVFKGYKGKFIYYAAGGILLSIVIGAIGTSYNMIFGVIAMVIGVVATIYFVGHFQKTKGLFNKTKSGNIIWVHQNRTRKLNRK